MYIYTYIYIYIYIYIITYVYVDIHIYIYKLIHLFQYVPSSMPVESALALSIASTWFCHHLGSGFGPLVFLQVSRLDSFRFNSDVCGGEGTTTAFTEHRKHRVLPPFTFSV